MVRSRVRVENPIKGIKVGQTVSQIDKLMKDFTITSLKDWVSESTRPIPVWSGAARASFLKLASIARLSIDIRPVAKIGSRIPLGRSTSRGTVIARRGELYGWEWGSTLAHITIVQERVNFVDAGLDSVTRSLRNFPDLPNPEIQY